MGENFKRISHDFEDPISIFLHLVMKVDVATFIDEADQFQHIDKATVWKEVFFPILNHPERIMLHVLHEPLVSFLQPYGKMNLI